MKKLILLSFTIAALASCGSEKEVNFSNLKAADEQKILCGTDGLPNDWVIVGHTNDINCRSRRDWNAYVVKKAGPKETVCSDSNIPKGYVKVRMLNTGACGYSFRENAYYIEKL